MCRGSGTACLGRYAKKMPCDLAHRTQESRVVERRDENDVQQYIAIVSLSICLSGMLARLVAGIF